MPSLKGLAKRAYARVRDSEFVKRRRRLRRRIARTEQLWREVDEHPERALTERTLTASDQLFYVFQGRGMALMMEPLTALRETGLIRSNLVMLRDYYGFFYHAGINRHIRDLEGIQRRLLEIRDRMPHVRRTACMGTSAGGYAALLFGHYMKTDTVYAFGPQTYLRLGHVKKVSKRKDVWRIPEAHRDLAVLLADYNGHTRYKVFFCEGNRLDRRFARRIADCPGVELYPQPGKSHLVLLEMLAAGTLRDAMPVGAAAELPATGSS